MAGRLLLLLTLLALPGLAHADVTLTEDPGPERGFWVGVHGGATFGTNVTIGNLTPLDSTDTADAAFGLSAYWRTTRFDIGAQVDSIGSGTFMGLSRERRIGSKTRVAALLRWRYLDESWGGLFMRLSPGWVALSHSDHIRSQVAVNLGREADQIGGIDTYNGGFTFGVDFGFMVYFTRDFAALLEIEIVTSTATIQEGSEETDFAVVQPVFSIGIEFAP